MISVILARLMPYIAVALGISIALNVLLGHELLASQEQVGSAIQDGNVRVLQSALDGSKAAVEAVSADDEQTIKDLQDALAREDLASEVRKGDIQRMQAALTAANRRLTDVLKASSVAAAWAAAPVPPPVLGSGLCWYDPASGYTGPCNSP